ncbi:hypothetical protein M0802_014233 [Mischocyttarus mexicanus]|nr:hypothetical protein M0802_014237 [Mischocyttarus mexicanus]KAI4480429.1 hypothetical protein M0802_014233 [Mischocyttarus mexicanus]
MAKPRSRSKESISSSEDDDITPSTRVDADGFFRPKKMRRLAKPASAGSIATNNSFGLLNDCSLDAEQGPTNESRNAYGARSKMQRNGTDASASPPEGRRSARPTPLHTFNVKAKDIIKLLTDNGLSPDKFYIRPYSNGSVNINAVCSDSHSTVKKILDNRISPEFTEDEVKADIESRNLSDINVIKVLKHHFYKTNANNFFFIVQLASDSKAVALTKIRYLLHQPIRWERLKRKEVFQCRRCQRAGHASINCCMPFRCVKCGQDHGPISESNTCLVSKEDLKSKLCCANCGSNGHPSSYGGCPYLETVQSSVRRLKQLTRAVKQDRVRAISRRVDPNISYANIMDKRQVNFPPLPRTENAFLGREVTGSVLDYMKGSTGTRVPSEHKTRGAMDDSAPNTASSSLEELFIQLQKKMLSSIATHMEEMNKKLAENSAKIEFIMIHLYAN